MSTDRPAIPALTGLRFIAAFSVLIGHAVAWSGGNKAIGSLAEYLSQGPALGMPLFLYSQDLLFNVQQICGHRDQFALDVNLLGDPVAGCAKDFSVTYKCINELQNKIIIPAEANGKLLEINCK